MNPKDKTKNLLRDKTCNYCAHSSHPLHSSCPSPDNTCEKWLDWSATWTVEFKEDIDKQVIEQLMEWAKLAAPETFLPAGKIECHKTES